MIAQFDNELLVMVDIDDFTARLGGWRIVCHDQRWSYRISGNDAVVRHEVAAEILAGRRFISGGMAGRPIETGAVAADVGYHRRNAGVDTERHAMRRQELRVYNQPLPASAEAGNPLEVDDHGDRVTRITDAIRIAVRLQGVGDGAAIVVTADRHAPAAGIVPRCAAGIAVVEDAVGVVVIVAGIS